jgi:hypothetical protein
VVVSVYVLPRGRETNVMNPLVYKGFMWLVSPPTPRVRGVRVPGVFPQEGFPQAIYRVRFPLKSRVGSWWCPGVRAPHVGGNPT